MIGLGDVSCAAIKQKQHKHNKDKHMALSNSKGGGNSGPLIFLSPRSKVKGADGKDTEVDPFFEVSRRGEDGKIKKSDEQPTSVEGDIIRLELTEREFNDNITKHAILFIRDNAANETYYLDLPYRLATRALLNSLLSLSDVKGINIGIYRSKRGYETFSLRLNDQTVKWKYELKDLPQPEDILDKKGKKVKTDFSEVDQFFEDNLKEFGKAFGILADAKAPKGKAEKTKETVEETKKEEAPATVGGKPIPF